MQMSMEESVWKGNHRVEMLLRNEVAGVLPIRLAKGFEEELSYDATGYLSLEEWCRTKTLGERELRWVLAGVFRAMEEGEAYLLQPGTYLLDAAHVFVKPAKEAVCLCVRPKGESDWSVELKELARFLLEAIDYKDEESVKLAYEFYHISKKENVLPKDCQGVLSAKVYTVISEDGEKAKHFKRENHQEKEGMAIGSSTGWIGIEAVGEVEGDKSDSLKMKKDAKRKLRIRIVVSILAVLALLVLLWQSGF